MFGRFNVNRISEFYWSKQKILITEDRPRRRLKPFECCMLFKGAGPNQQPKLVFTNLCSFKLPASRQPFPPPFHN